MTERLSIYQPTLIEKFQTKYHPDLLKVSGDRTFFTLQGEGLSMGTPAVFLRLHFCNLACDWCDTSYTWDSTKAEFWRENTDWDLTQALKEVSQYGTTHLVVTGGEPLLQQEQLIRLVTQLDSWNIEIETNGTIMPNDILANRCNFNVSPKLTNSQNQQNRRYKPEVLERFNELPRTIFKFVVRNADDISEIDAIVSSIGLESTKIVIMPEGKTNDDIRDHALAIVDLVKGRNWRLLPRLQVLLWGQQRAI